jgi:hypothetical protein
MASREDYGVAGAALRQINKQSSGEVQTTGLWRCTRLLGAMASALTQLA